MSRAGAETEPKVLRDERGAVFLMGIPMIFLLIGMVWYVVAIGDLIVDRERLQDAADSGALSAAIMHARAMNMIALVNQVMAALVAVLVTLRLFQTLMLAATAIATALAWPTAGASLAAVPPATSAANTAESAYNSLKGVVQPLVQGLHVFELGVKYAMPAAAQVKVATTVQHFNPPASLGFAIPGSYPLPVEKGTWKELCGKAGEFAGRMITFPITSTLGNNPVTDVIEAGAEGLATSLSGLFCQEGSGNSPGGIGIPAELPPMDLADFDSGFPMQQSSIDCKEFSVGDKCVQAGSLEEAQACNDGYQSRVNDQRDEANGLCATAAEEEALAEAGEDGNPQGSCEYRDPIDGDDRPCSRECLGDDGSACGEFNHRIKQSYVDCAPEKKATGEIDKWSYQQVTLQWRFNLVPVPLKPDAEGKLRVPTEEERRYHIEVVAEAPERSDPPGFRALEAPNPPCGANGSIGTGYNRNARYRHDAEGNPGGYTHDTYLCTQDHFHPEVEELLEQGGESTDGLTEAEWREIFEGQPGWRVGEEDWEFDEPRPPDLVRDERWPPRQMLPPFMPEDRLYFTGEWLAVTYVFGCKKTISSYDELGFEPPVDVEEPPKDLSEPGKCGQGDQVHHKMEEGLVLGSETFQMRAIVFRGARDDRARRVVEKVPYRLRGEDNAGGGGFATELSNLASKVFVAQAEYYYDAVYDPNGGGELNPEEWVWEANWRARIRRFRLPRDDDSGGDDAGGDQGGGESDDQNCGFDQAALDPMSACQKSQTSGGGPGQDQGQDQGQGASSSGASQGDFCSGFGGGFLDDLQRYAEMLIVH